MEAPHNKATRAHGEDELEHLRREAADLRYRCRQLLEQHQAQAGLVAAAIHELNTPIGTLFILAELLAANTYGQLGDKEAECARKILRATTGMRDLVKDLADLFRLRAGKIAAEARPARLAEIATRLEASFRSQAAERDLIFELEIADDLPPTIDSDPDRLEQLLDRLLRHALLATETGAVRTHLGGTSDAQGAVEIEVRYGGETIPADERPELFVPFSETSTRYGRRTGEGGLSLPLASELASLLGGELSLRSEAGGNSLLLRLPSSAGHPASKPG